MSRKRFLIVGLANPGVRFAGTRHNVGQTMLSWIGRKFHFKSGFYRKNLSIYKTEDRVCYLLKTHCWINQSGITIADYCFRLKIPVENLIVFYDDLGLSIGLVKISINKSGGGHNGVANVINHLHSARFVHVRIGTMPTGSKVLSDRERFVLEQFTLSEQKILKKTQKKIEQIMTEFLLNNWSWNKIMNYYPVKNLV